MQLLRRASDLVLLALTVLGLVVFVQILAARVGYPYDLEWMEGGELAHAWRLLNGKPVYTPPSVEWIPMIYPPGYPAVVAGLGALTGGLSLPLGRAVSWFGTALSLFSLAALVRHEPVRRRVLEPIPVDRSWDPDHAGEEVEPPPDDRPLGERAEGWLFGLVGAGVFLGAFENSGAFYDLVRPDALGMGLLALAVWIGTRPGNLPAATSGVLVAAAFLVKHNLAAFGLPLILAHLARGGLREAGAFGVASIGVALGMVGFLQLDTGGAFLTYLLAVPGSHPVVWDRAWPGSVQELGWAFPFSTALLGFATALVSFSDGLLWRTRLSPVVLVAAPVFVGIALGSWLIAYGRVEGMTASSTWTTGLYGMGLGMAIVASALRALEGRGSWRVWHPEWHGEIRFTGMLVVALVLAGWMRAHHGGYLNVYIPLFWVLAWGAARAAVRLRATSDRWFGLEAPPISVGVHHIVAGALALQLLWGLPIGRGDDGSLGWQGLGHLAPTDEDRRIGDRIVESLKARPGPVLSPASPWLPAMAGHEPGWHLISFWDVHHKGGPYHAEARDIVKAAKSAPWKAIVDGGSLNRQGFIGPKSSYQRVETLVDNPRSFRPRTGWGAHPEGLWIPKETP